MPEAKSGRKGGAAREDEPPSIGIRITPEAREMFRTALAGHPAGSGIRIWVERGMHPHPQMMVDRPSPRDRPLEVDGVLLLVDEASLGFLADCEIRFRRDRTPAGFEVVGPKLPPPSPPAGAAPSAPTEARPAGPPGTPVPPEVESRVKEALKTIYDPEIPMNIIDLGLIYGMAWKGPGEIEIRMTMTSPGCPAVEELVHEVERVAAPAAGAERAHVEVVWEPPWGPEKMSDFARRQFGYA
jgi:metal-sulfur cluster biosynthetic enzyme/Fe-S cluster assembly iron-binding protein IscA